GASVHSLSSMRPSSGAKVRAVRWRRTTSIARRLAVVISHADGLSGTPRVVHTSSARQNASCTTSSASARLCTPNTRVSAASRRPASLRNRCSGTSATRASVSDRPGSAACGAWGLLQLAHRPDLDRAVAVEHRAAARQLDRLLEILGLDHDEAHHEILDLDERAVGDGAL